jgi:hypothetical protein
MLWLTLPYFFVKKCHKIVVFHFERRIIGLYVMTNSRLRPFRQIY